MSQEETGRVQQKQRTRSALLAAARDLLASAKLPSIQDVADHAGISRATTYRYYSSIERLLEEAVLDGIAAQIGDLTVEGDSAATPALEERIEAAVTAIIDMVLQNENLFRTYLRNVVAGEDRPSRGARRVAWLDKAMGEERGRLAAVAPRLLHALSLLTGIETVVVAKDICGLDDDGTRELCNWAARAIVRAAIAEVAAAIPSRV